MVRIWAAVCTAKGRLGLRVHPDLPGRLDRLRLDRRGLPGRQGRYGHPDLLGRGVIILTDMEDAVTDTVGAATGLEDVVMIKISYPGGLIKALDNWYVNPLYGEE